MTTHSTRPAVALAWVLGAVLLLTRPEIIRFAVGAANWTLTTPAGTGVLAIAFVTTLIRAAQYRRWA